MNSHRLHLLLAIQSAHAAGFQSFAGALAEMLRQDPAKPYGVLHVTNTDRASWRHVETPKLKVA